MKWWQIRKKDSDLERELRSDLELEEEEQRADGLSPEDARYAALRALGNPTLIREQTHAIWSWSWFDSLARDLRYGFRGMYRNAVPLYLRFSLSASVSALRQYSAWSTRCCASAPLPRSGTIDMDFQCGKL